MPIEYPGFVGPSSRSPSLNYDGEDTINFFVAFSEAGNPKSKARLARTPGITPNVSLTAGPIRALLSTGNGRAFAIGNTGFWEVYNNGTARLWGSVATDGRPATMAALTDELMISSGGHGYIFDLTTNDLAEITDDGFELPSLSCAAGDGYFFNRFADGFQTSSISEGGTVWSGLDKAIPSQSSDRLRALIMSHLELWLPGTRNTAPWYNAGTGAPPYAPIQGGFIEDGIVGSFAWAKADNTLFLIQESESGNGMVFRASGYKFDRISTHPIEAYLQQSQRLQDTQAWSAQFEGHTWIYFYVPDLDTTPVYDVSTGLWHKQAIWDIRYERYFPHVGQNHMFAFGKHYIGDRQSSTIYTMDMAALSNRVVISAGL